jgi:hypothetical protein
MSQSPRPPKLNSTHQASARLNAWAADTLSALTSEEEATDKHDRTVTEDGNRYFAWAVAWLFPTLFFALAGVDIESNWQWLFWILGVLFSAGVMVNLTQGLWARRRRATLDSEIYLELLTTLEVQRRHNEEVLLRLKCIENQIKHGQQGQ